MNANIFDIAERGYEAACEMQYQKQLASVGIEAEAEEIWQEVVEDDQGLYRDGIVDEALGDLSQGELRTLSNLISAHQDQAAGLFVRQVVAEYWQTWCRREAEKRIATRGQRDAEDAAAGRYYERVAS